MTATDSPAAAPIRELGHEPVIPAVVSTSRPEVPDDVLQAIAQAYVADVADAVGVLYTLSPAIRPLYQPIPHLAGRALTVKAPPGDNLTIHGALGMVAPGDVLVIDWRGYLEGCATGADSLLVPRRMGLAGAVVDGAWRDIGDLQAAGFPVFGRGVAMYSPPKRQVGEVNVPVACGGVIVSPGDIIVGSEEGVVAVPSQWARRVADALGKRRPRSAADADPDLTPLRQALAERQAAFRGIVGRRA